MKLKAGMLLRVQTQTRDDVFGDVLWKVSEVDIKMKNPGNPNETVNDGVRCVLLGGSGPAARPGYVVYDTEARIMTDIQKGISEVVPDDKAAAIIAHFEDKAKDGTPRRIEHGGTGVVDFD